VCVLVVFVQTRPPPRSPLFPYTTLFRSGVMQIRQGLLTQQSVGPKPYSPYFLSLLVEACAQAGQPEAGLEVLAEALTLVNTTEADRKSTRLNSSHDQISYAVFCLKKKNN